MDGGQRVEVGGRRMEAALSRSKEDDHSILNEEMSSGRGEKESEEKKGGKDKTRRDDPREWPR